MRLVGSLFVLAALAVGCGRGGADRLSTATATAESAEPADELAAIPTAARPTPARPSERAEFVPSAGASDLRYLLAQSQSPPPAERGTVRPRPSASFDVWDGVDIVFYDIEGRRETNLGPGSFPGFTPDGRYLYWITGTPAVGGDGELAVFEIQTSSIRTLGEARGVRAGREAGYLQVQVPGGRFERVSLLDGSRTPGTPDLGLSDPTSLLAEHAGWRLESLLADGWAYGFGQYRLTDLNGSMTTLEFEVWQVALLPDGALVVATSPADRQPQAGAIRGWTAASDIFEVDLGRGVAKLIGRARVTEQLFPFAANERYVVWTEDFCNIENLGSLAGVSSFPSSNGRTRIYDRRAGIITELDQGFYVAGLTPRGELAIGAFGADALLDLETLEYTVVFPSEDRVWSRDYRYAAVGQTGGHGGYCGGE